MVSVLHSSALTESFLSSYHLYHLPLNAPKLASLSLAWHSTLWRSCFCWWRNSWHHFQGLRFLRLSLSPHVPPFSQTCSQKPVLSWQGRALQIPPFGLGENWLGAVLRGWCRGPSPVARPCQDPHVFPVKAPVPGQMEGGGRKRVWKAGSGILGSLCCDPYPSVLLWMLQYENNPITVDPCTASKTQQQRLIKTERVPIPSFVFAQCVSLSVCVCDCECVCVCTCMQLKASTYASAIVRKRQDCTRVFVLNKNLIVHA